MKRWNRKAIFRILGAFAFLGGLGILAYRRESMESIWQAICSVPLLSLIGATILFAIARIVQALGFRQALLIFGERLSFASALQLIGIKGFYNLTFQGAGIIAQAASVRANNILRMRDFVASTLLQSILLALSIGVSVAILAFALPPEALSRKLALLVGFGVAMTCLITLAIVRRYRLNLSVLGSRFNAVLADIHELLIRASLGSVILAGSYQLIFAWIRLTRVVFIAALLTPEINVFEVSAVVLTADLASLLPITPGGIGLREFLIGSGGFAIGHMDVLVAAAVVDRGVMIFGNLIHGLLVFSTSLKGRGAR